MADYFRQLRPASLRGVSFMTPGDDVAMGRRIVTHQYPGRDEPGHEDLGADVRGFTVEAVVAGPHFMVQAAALEAAIMAPGPAALMHPHYGEITVVTLNATRHHSSAAAGEVRFSIQMQCYGAVQFPTASSNTAAGLLSASQGGFAAILSEFNNAFRITNLPDFVTQDAFSRHASFMNRLNGALSVIGFTETLPLLDIFSGGFARGTVDMYRSLMASVSPRKKPVIGAASPQLAPSPRHFVKAMLSVTDQSLADTVPATTANRSAILSTRAVNAQSLDFLHRLSALGAGVGSVRHISFESRTEALAIRDALSDRLATLRAQLGTKGWDQSWKAAGDMQAALNRDISERIGRLPRIVSIRPVSVRSSLALANRLYGDNPENLLSRAADIIRRNRIRHPGFVPAEKLEVLIDAS